MKREKSDSTSERVGAETRRQRQRLRIGAMMRLLFSQQRMRRQLLEYFSIVRRRPAWAFRDKLSASLSRTTRKGLKWNRNTFEGMFRVCIELLVLGNFLYDFLDNYIVIDPNIAWVQFNVIIAGYCDNFYRFLRWSLHWKCEKCSSTLNSLFSIRN